MGSSTGCRVRRFPLTCLVLKCYIPGQIGGFLTSCLTRFLALSVARVRFRAVQARREQEGRRCYLKCLRESLVLSLDIRDFGHQCVWDCQAYAQVSGATLTGTVRIPPARTFQTLRSPSPTWPPALPVPFSPVGRDFTQPPTCCPGAMRFVLRAMGLARRCRRASTLTVGAQQVLDFTMAGWAGESNRWRSPRKRPPWS